MRDTSSEIAGTGPGGPDRIRLDQLLVARGFYATRARARDAIQRGVVAVAGTVETKPGALVPGNAPIIAADPAARYVSRGALKLIAALDTFGLSPAGRACLDIGASTGGFTQVLLERGARSVTAIDVGHGQLDRTLAADPRVGAVEGLNARDLTLVDVPEPPEFVTADVSFISLTLALPPALALARPGAVVVALIKPQFEVGRDGIGKGGIVRDAEAAETAACGIETFLEAQGWRLIGRIASPIEGGDGNREYLVAAEKPEAVRRSAPL
ncbi:TlyA family RNA methyltransferase [Prosthecomicrobium hirschii]|uniref:TlyA family RNA methyltransferase n=1 Tax=Prosthecodimorpha hirschii TaxID=665126 RepID=UPI00221E9768|nr:TlyA family RNA methyltransferase [Prosthecomicrobium hirschii]